MPEQNLNGKRVTCTLTQEEYLRFTYYAKKYQLSINELLHDAVEVYIAKQMGDVDLPNTLVQRVNQIIDALHGVERTNAALTEVITEGFDSLQNLARGENYLTEKYTGPDF